MSNVTQSPVMDWTTPTLASSQMESEVSSSFQFLDVSMGPEMVRLPENGTMEDVAVDCMVMPQASQYWSLVCEGILSNIVGFCGLLGNAATITVLRRPTFKETFHKLLICLSCFDSLFIGSAMLIYSFRAYRLYITNSSFIHILNMLLLPIGNISFYGSIYITLAVSIERFLGVVYPMQSRTRPRRNLWAYLLPVLLLAIGFNIPKALETKIVAVQLPDNTTIYRPGETELALNSTYTNYYKVWSNLIITAIVPITVLVFCNSRIFLELRKNRKEMSSSRQVQQPTPQPQSSSNDSSVNSSNNCQSPDHNLAMILAGIVIVFTVCHSFRFFLSFYHVSTVEKTRHCLENGRAAAHPPWLYVISALNHLMLMVNSSINFIIYCAVGSKFRQAVMDKIWCRNQGGQPNQPSPQGHLHSRGEAFQMNGHVLPKSSPKATVVASVSAPPANVQCRNGQRRTRLIVHECPRENSIRSSSDEAVVVAEDDIVIDKESLLLEAASSKLVNIQTLTRAYCEHEERESLISKKSPIKTCSTKVTDL